MLGIQTSLSHPIIAVPPLLFPVPIHPQGPPHHHIMVEALPINPPLIQITTSLYQTIAIIQGTASTVDTVHHQAPAPVQMVLLHSTLPHPINSAPTLQILTPQSYPHPQAQRCRPSAFLAMGFRLVPQEAPGPLTRIHVVKGSWARNCSFTAAMAGSY